MGLNSGMSKTFREWKPEQSAMFPACAMDLVPEDHLAHFIRNVVGEQLDLSEILDRYVEERGYSPYHPVMMVAVLFVCQRGRNLCLTTDSPSVSGAAGLHGADGNAETGLSDISLFRLRQLEALKGLFKQVLKLCQKAGMRHSSLGTKVIRFGSSIGNLPQLHSECANRTRTQRRTGFDRAV